MDKLINYLQEALDEDEAAKKALLSLQLQLKPENSKKQIFDSVVCFADEGNIYIMEIILSSIFRGCIHDLDLPIFISAIHLSVSSRFLRSICESQTIHTQWSKNLLDCINQILEVYLLSIELGVCIALPSQRRSITAFQCHITEIRLSHNGSGM